MVEVIHSGRNPLAGRVDPYASGGLSGAYNLPYRGYPTSAVGRTTATGATGVPKTAAAKEEVDDHDGMIFFEGRWITVAEYEAIMAARNKKTSTGGTTELAQASFPQFNIDIPNLSWNPTDAMRGTWLEEAIKRSALEIDPQVAGREQGLARFLAAAGRNRAEINPRYDRMSTAVANVFKNVVDQALVNNAIRRGAAGSGVTSGWLGQERVKAGREELGQRKGIENERNQLLDAINAQVLGKEEETSDALQILEALRGKTTDVKYADLERLARGDFLTEKQGTFENELQNAIFQSGYSTDQANYLLNRFSAEKSAQLGEAQLGLDERTTALNEALGQYDMTPTAGYKAADVSDYEKARTGLLAAQTKEILSRLRDGGGSELDRLMETFMLQQLKDLMGQG